VVSARLDLRAVDLGLIRSWVEAGPARAMLSINRQLGFHASAAVTTWQVGTERARAYLSGQA
jgi:hypothetical protein